MATILEVHQENGHVRGCNATCHNAKSDPSTCDCPCGGRFHGIGVQVAATLPYEEIMDAREEIALRQGEHVQLRIGA